MLQCLAISEKLRNGGQKKTSNEIIQAIKTRTELTSSEERILNKLALVSDKSFRIKFFLAWILYLTVFLVAYLLYFFIPEDRGILNFYLFAATGPLIMFTSRFSEYRGLWWLNKMGILVMTLVSVSLFLNWKAHDTTLYLFILVGMGPLMIVLGTSQEMRIFKVLRRVIREKSI